MDAMDSRRYIIDDVPKLVTWLEIVTINMNVDVGELSEDEIVRLTRLKLHNTLQIDDVIIRRVMW